MNSFGITEVNAGGVKDLSKKSTSRSKFASWQRNRDASGFRIPGEEEEEEEEGGGGETGSGLSGTGLTGTGEQPSSQ